MPHWRICFNPAIDFEHKRKPTKRNSIRFMNRRWNASIGRGKAHKKFEFGAKVGLVANAKSNWIAGAEAYPGNPYGGHTLKSALAQTTKILDFEPEMAICDLRYRGNNCEGDCNTQVVNRFRKRVSRSLGRWWSRRSAIEPVIGHCKSEHKMARNLLRGKLGDELNVIFAAAGFNFRKRLRAFALFLYQFFKFLFFQFGKMLRWKGGKKRSANRKEPLILASGFRIAG